MRILMISDIHGISKNIDLLKSKVNLDSFDMIVLLGDIFRSIYATLDDKTKIIKFMNDYKSKLIVVKGNCDLYEDILDVPVTVEDIISLEIDGINFYFTHGNKYNYYNNSLNNGVLVYGHEHVPYIKKEKNMIYINVGSISLPRNDSNKSFAIYENKVIRIYDLDNMNEIYSCRLAKNVL